MSKFLKELWTKIRNIGEPIGFIFLILGVFALIAYFVLISRDPETWSYLSGICLGLFSVGLGFIAIGMSAKSDKKYTEMLDNIYTKLVSLVKVFVRGQDKIEKPVRNVIIEVPTTAIAVEPLPPEVKVEKKSVEKKSKEAAQKRLDEDTQKVGFVRGEIYQLEDGSWGIAWGGKYPL